MVLLEFSISPLGKGESVSKYVSRALDIIDKSGVDYRLNPMGTVLEGEWDEVMAVVKKCYMRMRKDCNCLLYTSDAADDLLCVDLGGRRIIKKKIK